MKKALSLILTLFITVNAFAVCALSLSAKSEDAAEYGVKEIILPEGFTPVAYKYYDYSTEDIFPEYVTVVFDDSRQGTAKPGETITIDEEETEVVFEYIRENEHNPDLPGTDKDWKLDVRFKNLFDVYFPCGYKTHTFGENLKLYSGKIPEYFRMINLQDYSIGDFFIDVIHETEMLLNMFA